MYLSAAVLVSQVNPGFCSGHSSFIETSPMQDSRCVHCLFWRSLSLWSLYFPCMSAACELVGLIGFLFLLFVSMKSDFFLHLV